MRGNRPARQNGLKKPCSERYLGFSAFGSDFIYTKRRRGRGGDLTYTKVSQPFGSDLLLGRKLSNTFESFSALRAQNSSRKTIGLLKNVPRCARPKHTFFSTLTVLTEIPAKFGRIFNCKGPKSEKIAIFGGPKILKNPIEKLHFAFQKQEN